MPAFRVTDPESNQTLRLNGDSPSTEAELENIFQTGNRQNQSTQPSNQNNGKITARVGQIRFFLNIIF